MAYVILKEGKWHVVREKSTPGNYGPALAHCETRGEAEKRRDELKAEGKE